MGTIWIGEETGWWFLEPLGDILWSMGTEPANSLQLYGSGRNYRIPKSKWIYLIWNNFVVRKHCVSGSKSKMIRWLQNTRKSIPGSAWSYSWVARNATSLFPISWNWPSHTIPVGFYFQWIRADRLYGMCNWWGAASVNSHAIVLAKQ